MMHAPDKTTLKTNLHERGKMSQTALTRLLDKRAS